MSQFILMVKIRVKADAVEKFMAAVLENGKAARETEPGCKGFEILVDRDDPTSVTLYETYDDEAAFEAHQQTPHFKKYLDTALQWLDGRERQFMRRAAP